MANNNQHNQDKNGLGAYVPSPVDLNFPIFIKDKKIQVFYLRCERLAVALHIMSANLESGEPLRRNLRELALSILSSFEFLIEEEGSEDVSNLISLRLAEMSSLVSVAEACGYISEEIFTMVQGEISSISGILWSRKEENKFILPSSFFDVEIEDQVFPKDSSNPSSDSPKEKGLKSSNKIIESRRHRENKKTNYSKKEPSKLKTTSKTTSQTKKAEERRGRIIDVLKGQGELALNDIAKQVGKNCSRKTLQRDLNNLSGEGLIEKKGNKRWSTYAFRG